LILLNHPLSRVKSSSLCLLLRAALYGQHVLLSVQEDSCGVLKRGEQGKVEVKGTVLDKDLLQI
jgi:hypothetical protein